MRVLRRFLPALFTALLLSPLAVTATPASANSKYAAVVVDGHTGRLIYSRNADRPRYPASLTKVMTLYVLFEELDAGRVSLHTPLRVSRRAADQPPSKLGLEVGSTITVDEAIRALVTKSANDVAVVIAEHIGGSEYRFAQRMTSTARRLGMNRTRFMNASGLPNNRQLTTARDMANLAQKVQEDFPEFFAFFSITEFRHNGRRFTNHNRLVGRYAGTTGLKTGYTRASGFNLTTTVERDGKYLIGVVLGGRSARSRDDHMVAILDRAWNTAIARNQAATTYASLEETPIPLQRPGATDLAATSLVAAAPQMILPAPPPQGDIESAVTIDHTQLRAEAVTNLRSTTYPSERDAFAPESWVIQVGAYVEPSQAVDRIREAVNAAPLQLTNAVPITMPFSSRNQTLYRSRFGGFNEHSARSACEELSRASITCIAIPPSGWGRTRVVKG
ncbi:MAG: D-alanyl-D-alanine carboxypeptidase [Alphaproteobacteria bacterium]|nr:D-alanyl-D-alanine carboxypeptidase [Alphaproteobacteria bacterium]MBO6628313.1 D-alanyl-D-alanine carboxypeptidase [Alphaproteobacteria bacterium]MDF1624699.1 D-alanyl-D-alanine carboxypeptidase [Parvibaculaceae bacterium]